MQQVRNRGWFVDWRVTSRTFVPSYIQRCTEVLSYFHSTFESTLYESTKVLPYFHNALQMILHLSFYTEELQMYIQSVRVLFVTRTVIFLFR